MSTILVIDDEKGILQLMHQALTKFGHHVETADDGQEGIRKFDDGSFDIVITDHSLGDGTAFEILKLAENIPVIVVTGAGDEETAIKAWKAGAYDYLIKDLDQNYLKAQIRKAIWSKHKDHLQFEEQRIPINEADGKKIWENGF